MVQKEKILFIINPISGTRKKADLPQMIDVALKDVYEVELVFTTHAGHATELAQKGIRDGFKKIVSAGGDGTMNEVARALVNTDVAFGILPLGSGNGLARHLGIPMNLQKAIALLKNPKIDKIDTCSLNEHPFFCTAGVGFDAYISHVFATAGERGFSTYVKSSLKEFFNYEPQEYLLQLASLEMNPKAFLITFANTAQYGNNAYISPLSEVKDGLMEVCILKPFPKYKVIGIIRRLFWKSLDRSPYMETLSVPEARVIRNKKDVVHIDGDPVMMEKDLVVKIIPESLRVMTSPPAPLPEGEG